MIEASIKSSDLLYLSISIFNVSSPKGVIVIVPSEREYKERYYKMIEYFNSMNFSVYIYDPRGEGKSVNDANPLGYISDSKALVDDLSLVIDFVKSRENSSIYLLGDSLGALTVLNYLPQSSGISKCILISPLLSNNTESNMKLVNLFMKIFGKTRVSDFISSYIGLGSGAVLAKDPGVVSTIKNDELLNYKLKNISVYRILELQASIKKLKFNSNFNVLLAYGMHDKTICTDQLINNLANTLKSFNINVTTQKYNAGHKILFDNGNILIWQDIITFLLSNN